MHRDSPSPARSLLVLAALAGVTGTARADVPPGFTDTVVPITLGQTLGLRFLPDGRALLWEKAGRVLLYSGGGAQPAVLIDISEEVGDWRDHGLLGVATDPNFATNGRIYLSYVVDYHHAKFFGTPTYNPSANQFFYNTIGRITRYTLDVNNNLAIVPGSRAILVGESLSTGIPILFQSHGVGTLHFGEDGSLLASTGDNASFFAVDVGGDMPGNSNTALEDGIIGPDEDVGSYRSQLVNSLCGKILRLDPNTGDGLASNPFYDAANPRSPKSRVWAMGLRNPFRFALRPGSGSASFPGVIFLGDVGWERFEEMNVVTAPAQNFGWPIYEGIDLSQDYPAIAPFNTQAPNPLLGSGGCTQAFFRFNELLVNDTLGVPSWPNPCNAGTPIAGVPTFVHRRPALEWSRDEVTRVPTFAAGVPTAAIVGQPGSPVAGPGVPLGSSACGGVWYTTGTFPATYHNTYFHADFSGAWIYNFVFDANHQLQEIRPFAPNVGNVVAMDVHPINRALYYIAYDENGTADLRRISFGQNAAPQVSASASPRFGPLPLNVQFSSAGTYDPDDDAVTYLWNFGDGQTSTSPNPQHTYAGSPGAPINFVATLTVTDSQSNSAQRQMTIYANNTPPTVQITSPIDGSFFRGDPPSIVQQTATKGDNESPESALSCTWQTILHHNTHTHAEPPVNACATSSPVQGHGSSGDRFYFEFVLTVTDPQGLSTTVRSSIFPSDCVADVDDGSGTGALDGGVGIEDLLYYLTLFEQGTSLADIDDGTNTGHADGGVGIEDLLYYLVRFDAGC